MKKVIALAILISSSIAHSSPEGDPFYEANYAIDEKYSSILSDVKNPEPIDTSSCTATMIYNDYVDGGYGMN